MVRLCALGLIVCALACLDNRASAQVSPAPALINFQGRLNNASGTPVADGDYNITVSLWDAPTGGNERWAQALSKVAVKNGLFAVLLTPGTQGLFYGTNLWLQVQIGTDPAMAPRQQIASVPFALKSNTVPDGSIASGQLANDAAALIKVSAGAMVSSGGKIGIGTA